MLSDIYSPHLCAVIIRIYTQIHEYGIYLW